MLERPHQLRNRAGEQVPFGLLIAGDLTISGDRAFRIAEEVRHYAAQGRRVGLVQAARPASDSRIAREVQTCVRRGLAEVVDPAAGPASALLVVHGPAEIAWSERSLAGIRAERTLLVVHDRRDYAVAQLRRRLRGSGSIVWAPTTPWLRDTAPGGAALAPDDWLPPIGELSAGSTAGRAGPPALGWIETHGTRDLPLPEGVDAYHLPSGAVPLHSLPEGAIDASQLSLDRLARLDALACFPDEMAGPFPETLLRSALRRGAAVLLPQWLERHFGHGPRYCTPEAALAEMAGMLEPGVRKRRRNKRPAAARDRGTTSSAAISRRPRPVMFLASNGVGVGHLTRLLAIARRLDPQVPVIFVSQAQAVAVIERFGFRAEYLPSASYVGGDFDAWDRWFGHEMEQLVDSYDPAVVVYDGNNPSDGLIRAIAGRRDCRLAWVRRGLWGNTTSPFFRNTHWFDLVLEPGELEGQPDDGVTARRRSETEMVPPIRLLDEEELLPRTEAAAALGLDPAKQAVLLQLGAGYNRDIVSLVDELVGVLQQVPELQIGIAEWVNGAQPLRYWPGVRYLRGYPLSQYFRAFDFSIAAAGYNTFHEVISFALPTIFIPNRHPSMDDQGGRAENAQALQAAFELPEDELADLPQLVALLMDDKARAFLAGNCRRIDSGNGAGEAAQMIEKLAETAQ